MFEVLKKKGGGGGVSQYSTLLSLGGGILNRRLHQKSKSLQYARHKRSMQGSYSDAYKRFQSGL